MANGHAGTPVKSKRRVMASLSRGKGKNKRRRTAEEEDEQDPPLAPPRGAWWWNTAP